MNSAPVFVVGSARSGTTLLYHMLLSAGGFAVFRSETHAYDVLGPRFNQFRNRKARERFVDFWLATRQFGMSQLDAAEFRERVVNQCATTGDVLSTFMSMIAQKQSVARWAECTPAHLVHIAAIRREIPDALIVHIIRDGRDVALSAAQHRWVRPLPGDRTSPVVLAALQWRWAILEGRRQAVRAGARYAEVRFEKLISNPTAALVELESFVGQRLDYRKIQEVGIGSVSQPNTSFRDGSPAEFNPIGRYTKPGFESEVSEVERLTGDLLRSLGYPVRSRSSGRAAKRAIYDRYFSFMHALRSRTPVGRATSLAALDIW